MVKKKLNILLDLDQTIISAEPEDEFDFNENKNKAKKFEFSNMDGYYIIFERPGLQEFLDYLFNNFNVSVWTAASKDYALFIIDKIILKGKSNRKLDWFFFSYHCDLSRKKKGSSKDLSMIWDVYKIEGYNKNNTVIIDDFYDEIFKIQPDNCIIAPPFYFTAENSENDEYLTQLRKSLKNIKANKPAISINKKLKTV